MGRVSIRNLFFFLIGLLIFLYIFQVNFCSFNPGSNEIKNIEDDQDNSLEDISCVLNREVAKNIGMKKDGHKKILCKSDGNEVYVPFSFIKHYYETRGEFVNNKNNKIKEFELSHSYSKVYNPSSKYRPDGQFMHFKSFNVEARSRVLCVSAEAGVPVTTQWDQNGYYYPTQIAQFSLSHFSSHIANKDKLLPDKTVIEDEKKKASLEDSDAADRVLDEDSESLVIEFKDTLEFHVNSKHLIVCLDFKNLKEASFKIFVESSQVDDVIILNYAPVDEFLAVVDGEITFGFGSSSSEDWLRVTRDVNNDIDKALNFLKKSNKKSSRQKLQITKLQFSGHGQVTNISLSSDEHFRMFLHGADWFVTNQDPETGGWPTPVIFNKDRRKYPGAGEIGRGWYGAMCQGQAISVLVRAWTITRDPRYLTAAEAGSRLFNISSVNGGVKAVFLDKYTWFEEYPTNPPTFILNGFIYSLLGLYDLKTVSTKLKVQISQLFQSGLDSLAAMLPLYDTGSSTLYDLRHFTMKTAPKGARWDYHSTHINQLLILDTIVNKKYKIFKETAERWRGYMIGIQSAHN